MKSGIQNGTTAVLSAATYAFAQCRAVMSSLAAASAAANAVENHRQPDAADLRRLGLEGVTFKVNA